MQRSDDFGDIVRFKLQAGPGIAAMAEVTRGIMIGGGIYKADAFGFANRKFGIWHETTKEAGLILGWHREDCEKREFYRGNYGFNTADDGSYTLTHENNPVDIWNLRATLHVIIIGADLEIRFGQIVDFITGIFGYDLAGDDYEFVRLE
jgi:hypothetical protein